MELLKIIAESINCPYNPILEDSSNIDTSYQQVNHLTGKINELADKSLKEFLPISSWEFWLSTLVLCFGLIVIIIEAQLIQKKIINTDSSAKIIIVTLIIIGTLFLITAGYNNDQIAPAIGLLGTIAGYLLGRSEQALNTK